MTSNRSISIIILLAAFIVAGSVWTRPATGTGITSIAESDIAVVDIYHLVDILIMSDDASDQRAQFEANGQAQLTAYEQQLLGIQTQMSTMTQNDPGAAELYNQYQQVSQAIQQTTNQINNDYQTLLATQIADAYKEIHAAVNEVAGSENLTWVFATRRDADLVQTTTLTGVTQEILARPLVTPPTAGDITEMVRMHMGLPTMEEITEKIEAELAAAEAAAAEAAAQPVETVDTEPTPAVEITDD